MGETERERHREKVVTLAIVVHPLQDGKNKLLYTCNLSQKL